MRVFFFGLFIALSINLSGQVIVDGININEVEDIRVCQVLAIGKFLSEKVTILISYGQPIRYGGEGSAVTYPDGSVKTFNSVMHAINYMEKNGWEFIDALVIGTDNQRVYHYYFRKRPKEKEEKIDTDNQ